MLDFIGTIIIVAVMVVAINSVISSLPVSRAQRIAAATVVGLWIGFASASAIAGVFAVSRPFPAIGLYIAFPMAATAALAALSPTWRVALLGLPMPLLIGLNVNRVFGVLFLALVAAGRLSGPFPQSAGWGDVITGALALPAMWLALRRPPGGLSLVVAWNAFGTLDLVAALALGVTSIPGSPVQIFGDGAGSTAMQMLPWAFLPSVMVPFYLILHGILFAQLRQAVSSDGRLVPSGA